MQFNPDDLYDKLEENDRKCVQLLPQVIQYFKSISNHNMALAFLLARASVGCMAVLMDIPDHFLPGALQTIVDMHQKIKKGLKDELDHPKEK